MAYQGVGMTLTTVNATIYQGDDLTIPFVITDSTGAPCNIYSATFTWVLRASNSTALTITGLVFGDRSLGQVAVLLTDAETVTLNAITYTYQLEMVLSGVHSVEATGTIHVKRNYALV